MVWYLYHRSYRGPGKKPKNKVTGVLQQVEGGCLITLHYPYLAVYPSKPRAVMNMLMRTVKKTKTVATLFILFSFACFLTSFRSYLTESHTQKNKHYCYKKEVIGNQSRSYLLSEIMNVLNYTFDLGII